MADFKERRNPLITSSFMAIDNISWSRIAILVGVDFLDTVNMVEPSMVTFPLPNSEWK